MFLLELMIAFAIALLLVMVFSAFFRDRTPWGSFWIFLLIVFLITWVGGIYVQPFGPAIFEVAWLPFLISGILIILLLAATVPTRPTPPSRETIEKARETPPPRSAIAGLSLFFWVVIILVLIAIAMAYIV